MPTPDARPLRVLIANGSLGARGGTEIYARDLALELLRLGYGVACFARRQGPVADELRSVGVPVTGRLGALPWRPDVIHGNGHVELAMALAHFPDAPAVFVCHDHTGRYGTPLLHPRVHRYFGVSQLCLDRIRREGAPTWLSGLSLNWVDLRRFRPRPPLPESPRRALVLSNYASDATYLPAVREACRRAGLELDVVGFASGNPVERPEELLGQYDVVFAKAKAAMEAMAVGAATVLCDFGGVGPLVTTANFAALRPLNFGFEALTAPLTPESLLAQIALYDGSDAAAVRDLVRQGAGLEQSATDLVGTYREVIAEHARGFAEAVPRGARDLLVTARLALLEGVLVLWAKQPRGLRRRLRGLPGMFRLLHLVAGPAPVHTTEPREGRVDG